MECSSLFLKWSATVPLKADLSVHSFVFFFALIFIFHEKSNYFWRCKGSRACFFLKKPRSLGFWCSVLVLIISFYENPLSSSTFIFWFHWSLNSLIFKAFLCFLKSDKFFIVKSADLFNTILYDTDSKFCFPRISSL